MSNFIFYEPFSSEIEHLLNDPFLSKQRKAGCKGASSLAVRSFSPKLDLHEDTEKNLVTAAFEFPGISKDDIQLTFRYGKLTVSAETKKSEEHTDTGYVLQERLYGKFSRTLKLPQGVHDEQIKASMENGLLTITFPKALPELAAKKIPISDV